MQYRYNNFSFERHKFIVIRNVAKNFEQILIFYRTIICIQIDSFESTCHDIGVFSASRIYFLLHDTSPCSLCIAIIVYDIVKRYVRYISSGGETSLIWNKATSVKPIYFVSRTIGEPSSYFSVIFLGRFSTEENTNIRTRHLCYFCGVRLAGARYYVSKE